MARCLAMMGSRNAKPTVLVVEDEFLLALDIEEILGDLGFHVLGPVGFLSQALEAIEAARFDVALLDVNLHDGENSYRAADVLTKRGIPFALMTAYDGSQLARYGDHPLLQKPFDRGELGACVRHLLESAPANPAP